MKNSEIFVSVIKKPDIYFFGENQRFLLALKKTDIYFFGKGRCFSTIFVSVKQKPDIYFFGNGSQKMEIYSLYGGENQKPHIFSVKKSEIFVSVKKNGYLFFWRKSAIFGSVKEKLTNIYFLDIYFFGQDMIAF